MDGWVGGWIEGGRTFSVSTSKLWNSLPTDIRKKETIKSFKNALRNRVLDNQKSASSL